MNTFEIKLNTNDYITVYQDSEKEDCAIFISNNLYNSDFFNNVDSDFDIEHDVMFNLPEIKTLILSIVLAYYILDGQKMTLTQEEFDQYFEIKG